MKPFYCGLALMLAGCSSSEGPPSSEGPATAVVEMAATATPVPAGPTPPPVPLSPDEQKRGALTQEEYEYAMVLTNAWQAVGPVLDSIKSPESIRSARDSIQALQDKVDELPVEPPVLAGARTHVKSGLTSIRSAISSYIAAATAPRDSSLQDSFFRFAKLDMERADASFNKSRDIVAGAIGGKGKTH